MFHLLSILVVASLVVKVKIIIRATLKKWANRLAKDDKRLVILRNKAMKLKCAVTTGIQTQEIWIANGRYGVIGARSHADVHNEQDITFFILLTDCSAYVIFSENVLSSSDNMVVSVFSVWKNASQVNNSPCTKTANGPITYYDVRTAQAISSSQLQLLRTGLHITYTDLSW